MDRHDVPGATAKDAAQAHLKDLEFSERYSVDFISYWFDPDSSGIFCFANAPARENIEAVHRESHGLVPHEIIDVAEDDVSRFLGRIYEPKDHSDVASPVRTILFTDLQGSTALLHEVGEERFLALLSEHDTIIRRAIFHARGREVKHTGDGIMAAFDDAANGVRCAVEIQRGFAERFPDGEGPAMRVRVGLASGRPVDRNDDIYGTAVVLASRVCDSATGGQILVSDSVREMAAVSGHDFRTLGVRPLKGFTEPVPVFEVVVGEVVAGADATDGQADHGATAYDDEVAATIPEQRGRFQRWLSHALGRG